MSGNFQEPINKTMVDDHGHRYIRIKHLDRLYKVEIAETEDDLIRVMDFDAQFFTGRQEISLEKLHEIRDFGHALLLRDPENRQIVAVSQILFTSIPDHEVRFGEAFSHGTAGPGYGQVMYKAQEVVAREAGKERIRITIRLENTRGIRGLLKAGFRIIAYDPTRYGWRRDGGARLIMEKDLVSEQLPFRPGKHAQMFLDGEIDLVKSPGDVVPTLAMHPIKTAAWVYNENRVNELSHQIVEGIIQGGYTGIGLLQPQEWGQPESAKKLLIFQHSESQPRVDRLTLPVYVTSEFGRLNEVIVSYTPENAQIKEKYAINDVAKKNVNNIDPIAFKDEYNLFVGTLIDHDVRVVHTNAIGQEGKSAIFTRDPGFVFGDTFNIGRLKQPQRGYETDSMRQISMGNFSKDLTDEEDAFLEGGDIIFIGDRKIAVGIGQRTNDKGLRKLQRAYPDYAFIAVPHQELHLDVLFTMVGYKKCLADVTRLPDEFVRFLKKEGYEIILGDPEEQVSLGCNVVCLENNQVIAVKENARTNQRLRDHGVTVVDVSMPNVVKWGGGPRCMTCPTNRD